ncbi:MAG: hypothetical protein K2H78_01805, partial [Clostridia bacterium]|nr:hypothetical protein [Clostridia bacterium]
FGKVRYTENGTASSPVNYDADGKFSIGGVNYTAGIDENGVLDINGKKYYLSDGFTGTWYFSYDKERIEVTLNGVGKNGSGSATISYVADKKVASVDAEYDVLTDSYGTGVRLFVDDRSYGELTLDTTSGNAIGTFYSLQNSGYYSNAVFRLYDNFKGTWVGNSQQFDIITFDGRTATAKAEVLITDSDGITLRGTYTLDGTAAGKVTVGSNVYTLSFNEVDGTVSLGDAQLAKRDEWYGVTLYDASGNSYRFDGKGNLDDGGKVTVSNGTKLTYTVRGGSVTVDGNALTPAGSGFTCGSETLTFKSGFVGEWMISGADYSLIVEEVDSSFKAKVTYSDPSVTGEFEFVFNPSFDASSVALTYTEEIGGEKIVTRLSLRGDNEILITRTSVAGELTRNGIRDTLVDNWKGTYTYIPSAEEIESGVSPNKDTSWTFDGLGNAKYGRGKAIFTAADGVKTEYQYRINALGVPYIVYNGESLFVETSEGGYYMGGKHYGLVTPDALHEREVLLEVAEGETLHFIFDGISTLLRNDGDRLVAAYTYVITGDGEVELTEVATDKKYKGSIENRGKYDILTLTEITEN